MLLKPGMTKGLLILAVATTFSLCARASNTSPEEQNVLNRITYVYELKKEIEHSVWPGFNGSELDVPLLYFSDSLSYAANPGKIFKEIYRPEQIFAERDLEIYRTVYNSESPFNMNVHISFDNEEGCFYYLDPYIFCSSVEITAAIIPDVHSTEEWATMVMHEYFHGYQFRHDEFVRYFEEKVAFLPPGNGLNNLYSENDWFKKSVDMENEALLSALNTGNTQKIKDNIVLFFTLRNDRRSRASDTLEFDLTVMEDTYETMEGTARYVEYGLYGILSSADADVSMLDDPMYKSNSIFRSFNLDGAEWLYKTYQSPYFYATGFNICRLLDKLGIEYKRRLFKEYGLSLSGLLETALLD